MLTPFARFHAALEAVPQLVQEFGDDRVTDVVSERLQRHGERADALAGPALGAHHRHADAGENHSHACRLTWNRGYCKVGRTRCAEDSSSWPVRPTHWLRLYVWHGWPTSWACGRCARRRMTDASPRLFTHDHVLCRVTVPANRAAQLVGLRRRLCLNEQQLAGKWARPGKNVVYQWEPASENPRPSSARIERVQRRSS